MEFSPRDIQSRFVQLFGTEPLIVRAPGRINMIGEHTDYNDGLVMPAAIDREIFFGIGPSPNGRSVVHAMNYDERLEFDLTGVKPVSSPGWANYVLGVLARIQQEGYKVAPFSCVVGGNVPLGAGMSSSAAMECGFAVALNEYNLLNIPKLEMVKMAQWAEHNFVGVKVGIMDQYASMMGKEGEVIVLDCRSLSHQYAPIDLQDYQIVLCDTKVKHSLVDSEYNTRREECETGVGIMKKYYPHVESLRDVTARMLEEHRHELKGKVYDRCRYVVAEIGRVQQATADLVKSDLRSFGEKMFETHEGLSRLYEVSCAELDFLVEEARKLPSVAGARMMGGGFGGCTINLVSKPDVEDFIKHMREKYLSSFGIDMPVYQVNIVDGAGRVSEEELNLWV